MEDLLRERARRRAIGQTVVVVLAAAFYLAIVPVAVLLSGPIYQAVKCTLGECTPEGLAAEFILPSRGALQAGSAIRLPNGDVVGTVTGFAPSSDERYTRVLGRIDTEAGPLFERALRCEATANFSLEMDADLVVSTCPDQGLPEAPRVGHALVCGTIDHFERMGQELRRFVLENVRPGEHPEAVRLAGPCGADNEATTERLRALLLPAP